MNSTAARAFTHEPPSVAGPVSSVPTLQGADWVLLAAVMVLAALVRVVFFTGFFGSDEVTYVEAAIAAANRSWQNSTYIGSIRLGVNYPMAAAIAVFGSSVIAASLWGFLCSVLEVGVVYWFGRRAVGRPLAVAASLLIALLPLHVHLAGRVMADPPLALFISLSFVCLFEAEQRNRRDLYILAGACAGFVFWIKEAATVFVLVFAVWACVRRRNVNGWLWAGTAMAAVIAANFALMWTLSGNPLHLVDAVRASVRRYADPAQLGSINDDRSAVYYIKYLFAYIWHTWLLGYLAVLGVVAAIVRIRRHVPEVLALIYLLVWGLGLVGIFSLFVVSVSPLRLIPKQTNYMTIFLAPLCLLGGLAIVQLRNTASRGLVLGAYAAGALLLSALEQQTIRTFTANSRASLSFAAEHPDSTIHVVTNTERLDLWVAMVSGTGLEPTRNLRPMSDLFSGRPRSSGSTEPPHGAGDTLAIVDRQTLDWGNNGLRSTRDVPRCWEKITTLHPPADPAAGHFVTSWAVKLMQSLPGTIAQRVASKLESQLTPLPADVYRIPPGCG